jgi:hypothetical protein
MQWVAGLPAVFPLGTFWLARHARVTVRGADRPGDCSSAMIEAALVVT